MRKYTTEEMIEIYEDIITDHLPEEYVSKVKNSKQYKDFVVNIEKQIDAYNDRLLEDEYGKFNLR